MTTLGEVASTRLVSEMRWDNRVFIPVGLPTKSLIVWREKEIATLHPQYELHSALFAKVIGEARGKISDVLPATKENLVEAVVLSENRLEDIRRSLDYPAGVVGFPYGGRYIYNHLGQHATTEGGFESLPIEHKRGSVHELIHILPGMKNLPYWMSEGFCEAVPRFLLGYHDELQTTSYLQDIFFDEVIHTRTMDDIDKITGNARSLFSISRRFPFGENKAYMSALAYIVGLAAHMGNNNINQGLVSFYDLIRKSTSEEELRQQISHISSSFAQGNSYEVMNEIQKRGVKILSAPKK